MKIEFKPLKFGITKSLVGEIDRFFVYCATTNSKNEIMICDFNVLLAHFKLKNWEVFFYDECAGLVEETIIENFYCFKNKEGAEKFKNYLDREMPNTILLSLAEKLFIQ
jgi:hypothetical protein